MGYFRWKYLTFAIVACLPGQTGMGQEQSPVKVKNLHYLDSMEHIYRDSICLGTVSYEQEYRTKRMKGELAVIGVLNTAFARTADIKAILTAATTIRGARVGKKEKKKGLLRTYSIFLNSTYLHAELILETIDEVIVRKECTLNTTTHGTCNVSKQWVTDFKLLKEVVVREIDFPIELIYMRYIKAHDSLPDQLH